VKYRKKAIQTEISDFLKNEFKRLLEPRGIRIIEWNHDQDHIHVLFRANPNVDLSLAINNYKSVSSRMVKKHHPEIKDVLWKESFWSRSYCLLTVGGAPIEVIRRYIEQQGHNNR
jgi:putative transposase